MGKKNTINVKGGKRRVKPTKVKVTIKDDKPKRTFAEDLTAFGAGAATGALLHDVCTDSVYSEDYETTLSKSIECNDMLDEIAHRSKVSMKNKVDRNCRDVDDSMSEFNRALNSVKESVNTKADEFDNYVDRRSREITKIETDLKEIQKEYNTSLELNIKDTLLELTVPEDGEQLIGGKTARMMAYEQLLAERIKEAKYKAEIADKENASKERIAKDKHNKDLQIAKLQTQEDLNVTIAASAVGGIGILTVGGILWKIISACSDD